MTKRVERHINTTVCQLHDLFDGIFCPGVDNIRRAKPIGKLKLVVQNIDRDDFRSVQQSRTLQHVKSDTSDTKYRNRHPGLCVRLVDNAADTSRHRASDQRRHIHRDIVGNWKNRFLRTDDALSEHTHLGELMNLDTVLIEKPERVVVLLRSRQPVGVADVLQSGPARSAVPAARDKRQYATVARFQAGNAIPYFIHNARALVSQNDRHREIRLPLHHMMIGSANPSRTDLHPHFAVAGRQLLQIFDRHRLVGRIQNRCFNHYVPSVNSSPPQRHT